MASGLAVEDSGSLDLNAREQEGVACGVETEPPSAPDLDRVAEEGMIASGHRSSVQQDDVDASSSMDAIDVRAETQAGSEAVERSGVTSTAEEDAIREAENDHVDKESASAGVAMVPVPEVELGSLDFSQHEVAAASCEDHNPEVGVSMGSCEEVNDKDFVKVTQEVERSDSARKDINIQGKECSPHVHEAMVSSAVEAETMLVSGVDETEAHDGLCNFDSAHQDVGDTPCNILEVKDGVEEATIADEPSVVGDQIGVKVVQSSSGHANIAGSIDPQQEKEKCITDGSLGSHHSEVTIQTALEVVQDSIVQGSDDKPDGNDKKMATDEVPEVNDSQRIHDQQDMAEVTEVSNETKLTKNFCSCLDDTSATDSVGFGRNEDECLADAVVGSDSVVAVQSEGAIIKDSETCLSQMEAKMVVEDISFTEETSCMDNRLTGHNLPDSHLNVIEQPHGCNMMIVENEASVNVVGVKTERLLKECDVVKAQVEVGEISNGTELTLSSQLVTEDCSSVNEVMNHDAVEQFEAAEGTLLSEYSNTNEGLVAECTDIMDENQETVHSQMNQKESLTLAGETGVGEQSVSVVGINQNDLEVDNAIHGKEVNTQKNQAGSDPSLLKIGPSEETSENLDLNKKNISGNACCSLGCSNTMSDAQVSENRDTLLVDEQPIKNRDVTVPPAWSNIESKSSDICSTDCNLMEKEYFVMEGLNLSVEISVPTASELSEIQAVISQDIESADQINMVEDRLVNPGDIDMDGDHEPCKESEKQQIEQTPTYKENDQRDCYYTLPEEKHTFSISDLVWGKVKSHPWWPGQIFDPSEASELALKHQKKDNFLVAYFGDKTFAWCDESQLKPFETYFSQMEKQSSSDAFVNAIDGALEEVSRRTALGMTCFCQSTEATSSLVCQKIENAGIQEGSNSSVVDKSLIISCFYPNRLIDYAKALAQVPLGGADRLELAVAKAHLKAFYSSRIYFELPFQQNCSGLSNNDADSAGGNFGKGSTECLISIPADSKFEKYKSRVGGNQFDKQLVDYQREKTLLEPTDVGVACELANGGQSETGAETGCELVAVCTGKIRKAPDSDSSDSDGRKKKKLDSLGDMEMKLPSPNFSISFKVGECIRRVASQLTGSPSILRSHVEASHKNASKDDSIFDVDASYDTNMHSPKTKMANPDDSSQDELLSQLCAAAADPMVGYSFVGELLTFFTDFRNFCVVSSTEQSLPERSRRGRKRKVETQSIASILITDHMQDSYWSDLASYHGPVNGLRSKEATTIRSQRRKRKVSAQTSLSPSSAPVLQNAECHQAGVGSPHMKPLLIAERSIIRVEEKIIGECCPTALILNFSGLKPLPSGIEIIRIFSRYGPLKDSATEVQKKNNCVNVVFQRRADAEIAFSSIGKYSIFDHSLMSYRLRYLPLTPDPSPVTELQEIDVIPFEDVNFEILDNCQIGYISPDRESEDKSNEAPTKGSNLETPDSYLIAYASPGSKSEDKIDSVPVENKNFETADSHQAYNVSPDSKLQDKNVVPVELSSLEIPDNSHASYVSPDTSLQDKDDVVPMEDSNLETLDICQGNASPDIRSEDKDDVVPLEDSNLEIPDSCEAASTSQGTKSQDKYNEVPIEDSNLETSDICRGNVSLDTKLQDKDDTVPMEDSNIEIPDSCQIVYVSLDTKSQDKSDAVSMEGSNLETPDICQGNAFPDTNLQDKNDTVPMECSNLDSSDSHQITFVSPDTKLLGKNDVVPMEDDNVDAPEIRQGHPDDKSGVKNDTVPIEDSNLNVQGFCETASVYPYTMSQGKNDAVTTKDDNVETPDISQGSEDKDAVAFEDNNYEAPDQTVLASSDIKSAKVDAVTFKDNSLMTPDDSWTSCTPDTKPQEKNDAVPTEDDLQTPNNSHIACTSPDTKSQNKIDAVSVEFYIRETSEDCQIACSSSDTKSQVNENEVSFENSNLDVPVQVEKDDVLDPMLLEVPSQESIETLPQVDEQTG